MTIYIDDANWGCLLRGVLVGVYREETHEMEVREVPVDFFQPPKYETKEYLQQFALAGAVCLENLKVDKKEPVRICSGYVLGGMREWLSRMKYGWTTVKIMGEFQDRLERTAIEYVNQLGVGLDPAMYDEHSQLFMKCLEWLKGGNLAGAVLPDREKSAKTGWKSYHIWADYPPDQARLISRQQRVEEGRSRFRRWRR